MNFSLPNDALSFRGDSFHHMVEQFCGTEVLDLLQYQLINNSMDLIEINDPFFILQFDSNRTTSMKEALGISSRDEHGTYAFFVFPGIRLKLEKLIRSLRQLIPPVTSSPSSLNALTISPELIQRYPLLIDLIHCLESDLLTDFSIDFLSNLMSNIASISKNSFRYSKSIKDFALSLYVQGGSNLFEFLRLNIPGSVPHLTTLRAMISASKYQFIEGEFQYSCFEDLMRQSNCKYAVCGEDCTSVIPKVKYDSRSNSFVGFTLPLKNGFPQYKFYSTDSLNELELWHAQVEKSSLLNIHVIKALTSRDQITLSPFLLSAYGTNARYTAYDVLSRWSKIFDTFMTKNIRILGFSTDCDAKNLRAMRDSMAFFTKNKTTFLNHPDVFLISSLQTTTWFFLRPQQLFVCFQDGVHLCGKLRNRLLSADVCLLIGDQCASIAHLLDLIENQSKIDHGLVLSDVCVKDKQNYASCEKISSDAVLLGLKRIPASAATQVYVQMIRFVRLGFIEKSTDIIDRLYYAWCAVFIARIWSASLEKAESLELDQKVSRLFLAQSTTSIPKRNLFITIPALFSLEINAHSLTYLLLLFIEKKITEEALQVAMFNSQICESYFRAARSMSGPFSSVVNFSVHEFLHRVSKLSILQDIQCAAEMKLNHLTFPKHHKSWRSSNVASSTSTITTITEKIIEDTVFGAYIEASQILSDCNLSILNPFGEMISFDEVNRLAFTKLASSKLKTSNTQSFEWSNDEEESDDDDDEQDDEVDRLNEHHLQSSENYLEDDDDSSTDNGESDSVTLPNVSSSTIRGMRVFDSIDDSRHESFFRVKINDQEKYLHKQTATWYLSKDKVTLSSDRLKRVQSK